MRGIHSKSRVLIFGISHHLRTMIHKTLAQKGFQHIETANDFKAGLTRLEADPYDWVITHLEWRSLTNAANLLDLINREPTLYRTHLSLFITEGDRPYLSHLFEKGLLSIHESHITEVQLVQEIDHLLNLSKKVQGDSQKIALHYLDLYLTQEGFHKDRTRLFFNALAYDPSDQDFLMAYARALAASEHHDQCARVIGQVIARSPLTYMSDVLLNDLLPEDAIAQYEKNVETPFVALDPVLLIPKTPGGLDALKEHLKEQNLGYLEVLEPELTFESWQKAKMVIYELPETPKIQEHVVKSLEKLDAYRPLIAVGKREEAPPTHLWTHLGIHAWLPLDALSHEVSVALLHGLYRREGVYGFRIRFAQCCQRKYFSKAQMLKADLSKKFSLSPGEKYLEEAFFAHLSDDNTRAKDQLLRALHTFHRSTQLLELFAKVYTQEKDYQSALAAFELFPLPPIRPLRYFYQDEHSLASIPKNALNYVIGLYCAKATALSHQGQKDAAINVLLHAASLLGPGFKELESILYFNLGVICAHHQYLKDALAFLDRVEKSSHGNRVAKAQFIKSKVLTALQQGQPYRPDTDPLPTATKEFLDQVKLLDHLDIKNATGRILFKNRENPIDTQFLYKETLTFTPCKSLAEFYKRQGTKAS